MMFNCPSTDNWKFCIFSTALHYHISGFAGTTVGNRVKATNRLLWLMRTYWQVGNGLPVSEINRKSTEFLLNLYKQESPRSSQQKSSLNNKNRSVVELCVVLVEAQHTPKTRLLLQQRLMFRNKEKEFPKRIASRRTERTILLLCLNPEMHVLYLF